LLGPTRVESIARPFFKVNHHSPVTDVLLHPGHINKAQHISYAYHISGCLLQHLQDMLSAYSIKCYLYRGDYTGRILEPVGSGGMHGGIHGLLGIVHTELLAVGLDNSDICIYRVCGAVGMACQVTLQCARPLAWLQEWFALRLQEWLFNGLGGSSSRIGHCHHK